MIASSKWYIAQGNIGSGKTQLFREIVNAANCEKIPVFGFYQPLLKSKEGVRSGYDIVMFSPGQSQTLPFVRPREKITPEGMIWSFNQDTINKTKEFFQQCAINNDPSIVLFDEFGRIESKGRGHWGSCELLLKRMSDKGVKTNTVITCRKQTRDPLKEAMKKIGYPREISTIKLPAGQRKREKFVKMLIEETLKLRM